MPRRSGFKNVIAFDMGGTTAKCALVEDGRFSVDSIYYAGGYVKGFPIKSSVINIVEVGSGGGSIAWLDPQNRLSGRPAERRLDARPRLLRQRRHRADRDRRQSGARPAQSRPLPRRRAEARRRGGAQARVAADRRAARLFRRRRPDPDGGRHHLARHRHHGGRHQDRSRSSTASIRANSCCSATAAAGRCMPARWRASCRSRPS